MNLPRRLFPGRRRFWRFTASVLALAALVWLAEPLWWPELTRWHYWNEVRRRDITVGRMPSFFSDVLSNGLPLEMHLIEDGGWATARAKTKLLILRRDYPDDAHTLDYYLACWEFWSGDLVRATRETNRLGRPIDPVTFAKHTGDIKGIHQLAADSSTDPAIRHRAWMELAKHAEIAGRSRDAAAAYLKALETATDCSALSPGGKTWEAVRRRVGEEISIQDYLDTLTVLALRFTDQRCLEEVAFEIGKIRIMLADALVQEVNDENHS